MGSLPTGTVTLLYTDIASMERGLARMRSEAQMDRGRLEAAHTEGLAMTLDQAIAAAFDLDMT